MDNFPAWPDHLLALLFGIILPLATINRTPDNFDGLVFSPQAKKRLYITNSMALAIMATVVLVVWVWYRRPFSAMGFQSFQQTGNSWIAVASIAIFVFIYIADNLYNLSAARLLTTKQRFELRTPFLPATLNEMPLFLLMCVSAGVFEEIIYRGFLVTYVQKITETTANAAGIAILLPAFFFSVAHYYQGWHAILKIFVMAVLFGMIFVHSQSIFIVIILHTLVDVVGGLMSIWLHRKEN